jgi:hypothetical protein
MATKSLSGRIAAFYNYNPYNPLSYGADADDRMFAFT